MSSEARPELCAMGSSTRRQPTPGCTCPAWRYHPASPTTVTLGHAVASVWESEGLTGDVNDDAFNLPADVAKEGDAGFPDGDPERVPDFILWLLALGFEDRQELLGDISREVEGVIVHVASQAFRFPY